MSNQRERKQAGKSTRKKGQYFEDLAALHLEQSGYEILDRNVHTRSGEIDIVAREKDTIVFVEVRMRSRKDFGLPVETVTARKLKKLAIQAEIYLARNQLMDMNARLDIISVLALPGTPFKIEHFTNIYENR